MSPMSAVAHSRRKFLLAIFIVSAMLLVFWARMMMDTPGRHDYVIHGKAADLNGNPIVGAKVEATLADDRNISFFTDSMGQFSQKIPGAAVAEARAIKSGYFFIQLFEEIYPGRELNFLAASEDLPQDIEAIDEPKAITLLPEANHIDLFSTITLGVRLKSLESDFWIIEFEAENGEIIKLPGNHATFAPEDGYTTTLTVDSRDQVGNYNFLAFRTHNSQADGTYGWLKYAVKPRYHTGPKFFVVSAAINTRGAKTIFHDSQVRTLPTRAST